ncbi:hypothetical protein IEQ34_020576 [Dendrobium chrysotoxum]|uniref:PHD-type domain-containing protein n=1 Tax=Dendrobium chrysotoxum TaxID=161865 RepID=A0AAV7G2P0_DENCH|nr:hypothetical protein IEQ34_020576 [Dendrobium chrysotoxum]
MFIGILDLDHSAHADDESRQDAQSELFMHKATNVLAITGKGNALQNASDVITNFKNISGNATSFIESNTLSPGNQQLGSSEKICCRVQCSLCSSVTGAFHKSTNGEWVHAFCAEWLLESTYKRCQQNLVGEMEAISKENDIITCCICHNRLGLCLKCSYGHCQAKFYPTCARSASLFMNLKVIGGRFQHKAYCENHNVEQIEMADSQHGVEGLKNINQLRLKNINQLRVDLCRRLQFMLKSLLDGKIDTGWKYPDRFSQPNPPPYCGQPDIFLRA